MFHSLQSVSDMSCELTSPPSRCIPPSLLLCSHRRTWPLLDTGTVEDCLMDEDVACVSLAHYRCSFRSFAPSLSLTRQLEPTSADSVNAPCPPPPITAAPTPACVRRLVSKQEEALVDSDELTPGKHKFRKILPEC